MSKDYYTMLQEKLNLLTSEWVACHLTEEIVSGFYIRAKEELDLELAKKEHGIGEKGE